MIFVNSRVLKKKVSGVQRYLSSILNYDINRLMSVNGVSNNEGHIWEQFILPMNLSRKDVLWSPSNTGPLICPARQIVTMHDFATLDHPEWTSWQFSSFYRFLLPKLTRRCDGIIAISEYTKSRILSHVDIEPDKIVVIKNGVDSKFFLSNAPMEDSALVLKKYNITSRRYILSVSSIEPRKNISALLQAWSRIASVVDDDIHLVLVGRPNPKIFADAGLGHVPPRVIFTGYVDDEDLPVLYKSAYFFVYMSLYEGFGLPPLEAMAAGVAVITSNTTSIPEVVSDKAITVNPKSISDIAESMLLLIDNDSLRLQLALAGPAHAKGYSWEHTAMQTFNYLSSFHNSGR